MKGKAFIKSNAHVDERHCENHPSAEGQVFSCLRLLFLLFDLNVSSAWSIYLKYLCLQASIGEPNVQDPNFTNTLAPHLCAGPNNIK